MSISIQKTAVTRSKNDSGEEFSIGGNQDYADDFPADVRITWRKSSE